MSLANTVLDSLCKNVDVMPAFKVVAVKDGGVSIVMDKSKDWARVEEMPEGGLKAMSNVSDGVMYGNRSNIGSAVKTLLKL